MSSRRSSHPRVGMPVDDFGPGDRRLPRSCRRPWNTALVAGRLSRAPRCRSESSRDGSSLSSRGGRRRRASRSLRCRLLCRFTGLGRRRAARAGRCWLPVPRLRTGRRARTDRCAERQPDGNAAARYAPLGGRPEGASWTVTRPPVVPNVSIASKRPRRRLAQLRASALVPRHLDQRVPGRGRAGGGDSVHVHQGDDRHLLAAGGRCSEWLGRESTGRDRRCHVQAARTPTRSSARR